jgi:DNA-binding MarR family transcriptional regulator
MPHRGMNGGLLGCLAGQLLHRASETVDGLFREKVGSLTPREFAVLVCVGEGNGMSHKESQTGIIGATLSALLQVMAKEGLLHRRRSNRDSRAYEMRLTAVGRKALASTAPKAVCADASALERLSVKQREGFVKALKMIVSS